jgi:serine/threonine-protein kinase
MIGKTVGGKYELIRLVGQGGMGAVYEGRNNSTLKRCAVKVLLSPDLARNDGMVKRFFREARASSIIESDHIVQIYDSGSDPQSGFPYMVMELLQGEDLEGMLRRFGALHPVLAAKVMLQSAMGLARAHEQGIVHRDIKPANLFVTRREMGDLVVKLLDFGIAKVKMESFSETSAGLTRTGSMLGTPLYMSPEQAKGAANIDARSDVWSLGVVLYECLSGGLPYSDASSLGELMVSIITCDIPLLQDKAPWVPPELAEVAHRAMSRDINRRFQNAGEMRDALNALVTDGPRITPEMVAPVPPEQRQYIAPRLTMTDDGMLRATTRTGLTVARTQAVPVQKSSSGGMIAAGIVGVLMLGVGGTLAYKVTRPKPEPAPAAQPSVIVSTIVRVEKAPDPTAKTFSLGVTIPDGAEVSVDGVKQPVIDNRLMLTGLVGTQHKIDLSYKDQQEERVVVISDNGLVPDKVELVAKKVAAAGGGGPARPAGAKADGKPDKPAGDAPKSGKKAPQVETGIDEFK